MRNIQISKKVIKPAIGAIIVILLMFRIGIITPTRSMVIWHFNANRQSFQNIADLMRYNNYDSEGDLLKDEKLQKADFIKIRFLFVYSYIQGWYYSEQVSFDLANLAPKPGEPMAIVYSNEKPEDEQYGDWEVEYEYAYEDLGGNWYLEYRRR